MRGQAHFLAFLCLILFGGVLVNVWARLGESQVARKDLSEFPRQIGSWQQASRDQQFDAETMSVLKASDYLLRDYRSADGRVANFYVGYYATQRDGSTYHSPLNCLPGAGWTMDQAAEISIKPSGRNAFIANRYLIQNGSQRELLIYWYQGRGRSVASEYWGKIYTVLDSVRLRRSDGGMIRVTTPVGASEVTATESAADLAANAANVLPEFIPD